MVKKWWRARPIYLMTCHCKFTYYWGTALVSSIEWMFTTTGNYRFEIILDGCRSMSWKCNWVSLLQQLESNRILVSKMDTWQILKPRVLHLHFLTRSILSCETRLASFNSGIFDTVFLYTIMVCSSYLIFRVCLEKSYISSHFSIYNVGVVPSASLTLILICIKRCEWQCCQQLYMYANAVKMIAITVKMIITTIILIILFASSDAGTHGRLDQKNVFASCRNHSKCLSTCTNHCHGHMQTISIHESDSLAYRLSNFSSFVSMHNN